MLVTYQGKPVVRWVRRELLRAVQHGWRGQLVSGYRTDAEQLAAAKRWAAALGQPINVVYPHGPLASNHCGKAWPRGACDVTEPRELALALRRARRKWHVRRLTWALDVGHDDPPHFSRNGH